MAIVKKSIVGAGGVSVTVAGARLIVGFTPYTADVNEFCYSTLHCKPNQHLVCSADINVDIARVQDEDGTAEADRVGRCLDVEGIQDSAAGLQADFDRLPVLARSGFASLGAPYKLPPNAVLLIGSGAGYAQTTVTEENCVTYAADDAATVGVVETTSTVYCPGRPFISIDSDLTVEFDWTSDGVYDHTNQWAGFEGSLPAFEGHFGTTYTALPTVSSTVRVRWTRNAIGLWPKKRVRFDGNGSVIMCSNSLPSCFQPELSLLNNPNESDPDNLTGSSWANFTIRPVSGVANTNWGFVPVHNGAKVTNIRSQHFGRCFYLPSQGEVRNANSQRWWGVTAFNCYGAAIWAHGADCNANVFIGFSALAGVGIKDDCYIGSMWFGTQIEGNTLVSNDPASDLTGKSISFETESGPAFSSVGVYLEDGDPNISLLDANPAQGVWISSHIGSRLSTTSSNYFGGGRSSIVFQAGTNEPRVRIPGQPGTGAAFTFEDPGALYGGADGFPWYLRKDAGRWKFDYTGVTGNPSLELPTTPGSLMNNGGAVGPVWAQVTINHDSIAAGAFLEATGTMTNVNVGDVVTCVEGSAVADGTFPASARATAAGTVAISRGNPTAGAINPASITYNCRAGVAQSGLMATASIDPPNIAADTTAEVTMTMTGLVANTPVWCSPAGTFTAGVSCLSLARASADNTVSIMCANISGGAVDAAAVRMYCRGGAVQNAQSNTQNLDFDPIAADGTAALTMGLSGVGDRGMAVCSPNAALPAGIFYTARGVSGNGSISAWNISAGAIDPASVSVTCYGWMY